MSTVWPELPYPAWRDTQATLQLWTQIVGKIRLTRTPWLNHSWHVALYVTSRGLTTSPIPHGDRTFEIQFDFIAQQLIINVSDGATRTFPLRAADRCRLLRGSHDSAERVERARANQRAPLRNTRMPSASAKTAPTRPMMPDLAQRFWQALVQIDRVFKQFRTGFVGKASPVHFFWGSFDLAVTRFSGRRAPAFTGKVPGLNMRVMQEAYSHEVSSAGFWPGGGGIDYAAFYSYAYPTPGGFQKPTRQTRNVQRDAGGIHPAVRQRTQSIEPRRNAARVSAEHLRGRG